MNSKLIQNYQFLQAKSKSIKEERMEQLDNLNKMIANDLVKKGSTKIICICTHNSRRSILAQAMLSFISNQLNINNIEVFSGGIEVTEVHRNVIEAFENFGFEIQQIPENTNSKYTVTWGNQTIEKQDNLFSKLYDDPFNPSKDFIAMMVCSDVEKNCPMVKGSINIISMNYTDPKHSDGTEEASNVYLDKLFEIGAEMFYVLQKVKSKLQ
jgi:arsenate reductase (thioredoxin)